MLASSHTKTLNEKHNEKKIQIRFSHTGEVLKVNIIESNSAVGLTINYLQPSENYSRVYKLFTISKYANIPNHIT